MTLVYVTILSSCHAKRSLLLDTFRWTPQEAAATSKSEQLNTANR